MLTPPLLTIGAFARAVGLTPGALRHYDECGLLVPAEVDDASGYRYYTPDLARRARLVAAMREAGVPIDTMRRVLDGRPDRARELLEAHVAEQSARAARAEQALVEVLAGLEAEATPVPAATAVVEGRVLAAALRQVRAAAEIDPLSPLSGVLLDLADGSLDVVATNRFWMAVRTLPTPGGRGAGRVVVPLPGLVDLVALLDRADTVELEVAGDRLTLRPGTGHPLDLAGRGGAYPAHRVLLDALDPVTTRAVLSSPDLRAAIDGVGRAEVELALTASGGLVGAPGAEPDAAARVEGGVDGDEVTLLLGGTLAQRGLAACLGEVVVVEAAGPVRPVVLRSPYQQGFLALVMPIRPS